MSTLKSYRSANEGCSPRLKLPTSSIQHSWIDSNSKFVPAIDAPKYADVVKSEGLPSLMALGALATFGAASYGLLRNQWERNVMVQDLKDRERRGIELKERQRIELKERQRLENERLFQVAVTGLLVAVAVLALLYTGWFYLLLAVMIAFTLFTCSLS